MWLGTFISGDKNIYKGVPQGSILRPVFFLNIFINDIFYSITNSDLSNYADDNTVSYFHHDQHVLKSVLTNDSCTGVNWFPDNHVHANPDKC